MRTTKSFKRFLSELTLGIFVLSTLNPISWLEAASSSDIIYPLKKVSKLECRFNDFEDLGSNCIQDLPILKTKDYSKYASQNGGYNDFTRLYTVLWGASYKYGWDVWNWGHIWTDIATAKWTPVYAMADGTVIKAVANDISLWNYVSIQHTIKGKTIVSNYAHLSVLNVYKGQKVSVWKKIWEVGSTWNSTWNHLHFQIDLATPFHPYYYDYNKCPYSYYKITEDWVCYNELAKNTIDPLLFLETSGAVLNQITTTTTNNNSNTSSSWTDFSIFNRTVYTGYSVSDIKEVQEIFRELNVYKGDISGDYNDIEDTIIAYQISRWIIANASEYGAGRFGPKTREVVKAEYIDYIENGVTSSNTTEEVTENNIENQKIERENLMSREEIERREVEEFLRYHNIELNFVNEGWNIQAGTTETLKLVVTDRKGKAFKWEMPWGMTFVVNTEKATVFPEKLFYFTDWKRDIRITWVSEWNTTLYVKIWEQVIKTIPLKVFKAGATIYPATSKIISASRVTLWDSGYWVVAFKDESDKYLINLKYGSTFNIKASDNNKICIKTWDIRNIKTILKADCEEDEYQNEFNFTYDDTVWGLLMFNYKATSNNLNIKVTNNYNNQVLSERKYTVSNPKGLNKTYVYTNEIMSMLWEWIVDWINQWYFLQDRWLTQRDAFTWIQNALIRLEDEVYDTETKNIIEANLTKIEKAKPYSSRTKIITREDFLNLSYEYLVFNTNNSWKVEYKDIDSETATKLAKIFDENTTWKDQFGESYFRPEAKITRWEWAFFLSKTLEKQAQTYLTLK